MVVKKRTVGLVFMLVLVHHSRAATVNQVDVENQLKRLQMQLQGFQTQLTEQLNLQKVQISAMEKLLDTELKAMQTETSSLRTEMKAAQSEVALVRKEIQMASSETTSKLAALSTSLQAETKPIKTGIKSVQAETSSMGKQLKAIQGNTQLVTASITAVETQLSTVNTKIKAVQSGMTQMTLGVETVKNKMSATASLINQYKQAIDLYTQQQDKCCRKTQDIISSLHSTRKATTTTTTLKPTTKKQCPSGYEQFKSSCYKVYAKPALTFQLGLTQCKHDGGAHLLAINSASENDFVKKLARTNAGPRAELWIGGTERIKEGVWRWQSSGAVIKYTNWQIGEPNNFRHVDEDCIMMHAAQNYKWHDAPCYTSKGFICELELV